MNREIKFRAWDESGYMVSRLDNYTLNDIKNARYLIWMQFTGLKDKNGVEIYEGDILMCEHNRKYVVKWSTNLTWDSGGTKHSGFYPCDEFDSDRDDYGIELDYNRQMEKMEVIGNIYETPKLKDKCE